MLWLRSCLGKVRPLMPRLGTSTGRWHRWWGWTLLLGWPDCVLTGWPAQWAWRGDRWVVAGQCSERSNSNIFPCNIANKMQWVWFLFLFCFFFLIFCIYMYWSTCKIWHGSQCIPIKLCTLIFFLQVFNKSTISEVKSYPYTNTCIYIDQLIIH